MRVRESLGGLAVGVVVVERARLLPKHDADVGACCGVACF